MAAGDVTTGPALSVYPSITADSELAINVADYAGGGGGLNIVGSVLNNAHNPIDFYHGATKYGSIYSDYDTGAPTADLWLRTYEANARILLSANGSTGIVISEAKGFYFPAGSAPASPVEGSVYMDSTTHKLRAYDGSTWQDCW